MRGVHEGSISEIPPDVGGVDERAQITAGGAVLILINSAVAFPRFRAIADCVERQLSDHRVIVLATHPVEPHRCVALYEGYEPGRIGMRQAAQLIREEFNLEPAKLYVSDLEYQWGTQSVEDLVPKCLHVLRRVRSLVQEHGVSHVFMPGGGTMVANAVFEYASGLPHVGCYRIHPLHYLGLREEQPRYFFADNNRHRLPVVRAKNDPGVQDDEDVRAAKAYINAVRSGAMSPDRFARKVAKSRYFTPGVIGMIMALVRYSVGSMRAAVRGRGMSLDDRDKVIAFFRKLYLDLTRRPVNVNDWTFMYVCHHPSDSQLLLRGRQYRDQLALCHVLASNLPTGAKLLVKEHPVYPGMLPVRDIRRLQALYPNVQYVDYSVSFSELVKKCKGVIVINSTAGLEAAILNVPVIVLGDAFYDEARFVRKLHDLSQLTDCLKTLLINPERASIQDVQDVLVEVHRSSEIADSFDDSSIAEAIARGVCARVEATMRCEV